MSTEIDQQIPITDKGWFNCSNGLVISNSRSALHVCTDGETIESNHRRAGKVGGIFYVVLTDEDVAQNGHCAHCKNHITRTDIRSAVDENFKSSV